jgi:immunity protein Imm1 of predicted polymorphic toxin system
MAKGVWSDSEPAVEIDSVADLERFIDEAEARCGRPVAVSVDAHGYTADLLVGHEMSFVHLRPSGEPPRRYFVTVGGIEEGMVEFWLQTNHHTEFEARHLVPKVEAREVFIAFFQTGARSSRVQWEEYSA